MRIGILTYHDETNYGSVLQAYAMQNFLHDLGHEAFIIDRWYQPKQERLYGILHSHSVVAWCRWLIGVVFGLGVWGTFVREWRSRKFIQEYLNLTSYHFCEWENAPSSLGLDLITVGSDQVWHPGMRPDVYLLLKRPTQRVIAYSASFGCDCIPTQLEELYKSGLSHFSALGLREKEAVELVKKLGFEATHVVDPTLLVNRSNWSQLLENCDKSSTIVGYFLLEDEISIIKNFCNLAARSGNKVEVFFQGFLLPMPFRVENFKKWLFVKWASLRYGVKVRFSAGPCQFVQAIAKSKCVFTNSFHALMFSLVFRREIRVVSPSAPVRRKMMARINEFADELIQGPLLQKTLNDAIRSYVSGEHIVYNEKSIQNKIVNSKLWLQGVLEKIGGEINE